MGVAAQLSAGANPGIRTLNLVWQQTLRGVYGLAPRALDNGGSLTVVAPRPLQARTWEARRIGLDGSAEALCSFAVERLLKLDLARDGCCLVGMTADDVYLFQTGAKQRFLEERRVLFIDAAVSASGERIAVVFSDFAGTSFATALGDCAGRASWIRDLDFCPASLALSGDGRRLAIGAEAASACCLDARRREVWRFETEEAVRAVALSDDGARALLADESGRLTLLDAEGARLWAVELDGRASRIALSGDGRLAGALVEQHGSWRLCLAQDGHIDWDQELDAEPDGLSLSPDGRIVAVSEKGGQVSVCEVVRAEGGRAPSRIASGVLHSQEGGDRSTQLRQALLYNPADVEAAEELQRVELEQREAALARAEAALDAGDLAGADQELSVLIERDPLDIDAAGRLKELRRSRVESLLRSAGERSGEGRFAEAEAALVSALTIDSGLLDVRRKLRSLSQSAAAQLLDEAKMRARSGELQQAVAALERAQKAWPSEETARLLDEALVALELKQGMEAYNAGQFAQAAFQFRKVLRRDPQNATAARHLRFAERFARGSESDTGSERFKYLEE